MKYINAADVLPEALLKEVKKYVDGELLYIPITRKRCLWGEKSGSRQFFLDRNKKIKELFEQGKTVDYLTERFGLSGDTIKRIIRD